MKLRYRDGSEDDDRLYDLPIEQQREYVVRCLGLGPNWIKDSMWERMIDMLLSIRKNEGKATFYHEIGRMMSPDID